MKRAIGYVRVSTAGQADEGVSLEAQESKVRAVAVHVHEADLLDVIVDGGASAKSLDRSGIQRLLALVDRRQVDMVIVAKLDRLTRSVKDLGELLERFHRRGVSLVSVAESLDTDSAAGRLVINIMGAVSQWEREAIGERTREALAHKRGRGERTGNIPFGYQLADDGVHLEKEPREQATLQQAHSLREQGLSLRRIAARLNWLGLTTRRGTEWRFQYVADVLGA